MGFEITKVDMWVRGVDDLPGTLAEKLEAVVRAGANLDFVIARPLENQPSAGIIYVAPLYGREQTQAAEEAGFRKTSVQILKIAGPDRPGLAAGITRALADAHINIVGMSAAAIDDKAMIYLRFDTEEDVDKAGQLLTAKLG